MVKVGDAVGDDSEGVEMHGGGVPVQHHGRATLAGKRRKAEFVGEVGLLAFVVLVLALTLDVPNHESGRE